MELQVFYVYVHVLWKAHNVICSPVLQNGAELTWEYSSKVQYSTAVKCVVILIVCLLLLL